jgi:hypothetical protein
MSTRIDRRAVLAGLFAAVPTVGVAAALAPTVTPPDLAVMVPPATTPIGELWKEWQALEQEYKMASKLRKRLQRMLAHLMPKPDPSITYSADNDADGLEYWSRDREPHTLHRRIPSRVIEEKLSGVRESRFEQTADFEDHYVLVVHYAPQPLSPEQLALQERLAARLELSQAYERKIERVSRKLGLLQLEKKIEKRLLPAQGKLSARIMSLPPVTTSDIEAKIAIWREWGQDADCAADVIRDLERLIAAAPGPLAFALAAAANAGVRT